MVNAVFQLNDDSDDTQKASIHPALGTQWIDYSHESENNDPVDPSILEAGRANDFQS